MKKKILLFLSLIIGILLISFITYKILGQKKEETKLIDMTIKDLESKINTKETFVLVISQTGCSHCEQYLPELEHALQDVNINAFVLNVTKLNKEETNQLATYISYSGTPTTIFFIEGEEKTTLNRIIGYASKNKIIERLKSLGYVN